MPIYPSMKARPSLRSPNGRIEVLIELDADGGLA
jgi:hypothetical protein